MDKFLEIAENIVIYKIRKAWHEIGRMYNELASDHGGTMSMGFILLTLNDTHGTPVTKIAPRMGMEPNSLSRILKSMEENGLVFRRKDKNDKRKVYICLTEQGKKMQQVAVSAVFELNNSITKDLDPKKLMAFFEVINHVEKAVSEMTEQHKLSFGIENS